MTAIDVRIGRAPSRKAALAEARKRLTPLFIQMAEMIADDIRGEFDWDEMSFDEPKIYLLLHELRYIH